MTLTNLEKYVYSKKCLKSNVNPPPLPSAKSKVSIAPKESPGYEQQLGAFILDRPAPIPNKVYDWLEK